MESEQPKKKNPVQPKKHTNYSRPVFNQTLTVNSLQAQRVMSRSFDRVSNSLFSIDVILRIIGEQAEVDQIEGIISEHMSKVSEDLDTTTIQMEKIMADNGIDVVPGYTAPTEYIVEIKSPQIAQFTHLVRKLDTLMGMIDSLWLNAVLSGKQRTDANYQWQQRLVKLAGRVIGIEKRARISAHSKGKEKEVTESVPEIEADASVEEALLEEENPEAAVA